MSRARPVERLITAFSHLPSIGTKTSERLAYFLLRGDGKIAEELAEAIREARAAIKTCSRCFNLDETDPCSICVDDERERDRILVVEDPRDVTAFEEAGYRGLYHVLQGRLSSLEGVKPEQLTVAALLKRIGDGGTGDGGIVEVCLATNPDLEGEGTARVLAERLEATGVKITRLARGIPSGSTITQVSSAILADAIEGRRDLS